MLKKIGELSNSVSSLEKKLEKTNDKIEKISKILAGEQSRANRAIYEQITEQSEQSLDRTLQKIRGRHREMLNLFINDGFHTYEQIAKKMDISQSRARAYVAELKNDFGIPLRQVRDSEGYKIGIDVRFIEQILVSK